jgi:hypothetical protein
MLAVAAGLALSGSIAKADFTITHSRVVNGTTDTVSYFLQETASGSTAGFPFVSGINIALLDETSSSGMQVATSAAGKANAYTGVQTHLITNITDGNSTLGTIQSNPAVLNSDGSITISGSAGSTPYAASSTIGVQGLGGAIGDSTGAGIDMSGGPILIASVVVNHNDTVALLNTTPTGDLTGTRVLFPTFQPSGTDFLVTTGTGVNQLVGPSAAVVDAVPEPTSLGLVGLAMGGLIARRRRSM